MIRYGIANPHRRRSRNGSTVFAYALKNRKLAESLVKRLGGEPKNPQLQLL